MKNKTYILVLAGSVRQYEEYLRENNLTPSEALYGYDERSIRGIRASAVVETGLFWERIDARYLYDLAMSRVR